MNRSSIFEIVALLGVLTALILTPVALTFAGTVPPGQEDDEDWEEESVPELDAVIDLIAEMDLEGAEEAFKAAKKDLRGRKKNKAVKKMIDAVESNLEALEMFEKAKDAIDKGKTGKAFKAITKVMRKYGELYFVEEAESVYSELKQKIFYMINDFETEAFREAKKYQAGRNGSNVELVSDRRFARDGSHALKVHFDKRGDGVKRQDSESFRAMQLNPPDGFSKDLEDLKSFTLSIFSYKKSNAMITIMIAGGGAASYAEYADFALNYTGWKDIRFPLIKMKFRGSFQWRDAREIRIFTRGPLEVDFIVDDVKFIR
ncbi:MAG: hypothetical protein O7H41_07815 [Planctomycetota bacterium]|nr:hypothetical protein [Planctomycetota bacterium]